MSQRKWYFENLDHWEGDGFLVVDGTKHYFQFQGEPDLGKALQNLFLEGKIKIVKDDGW
jgi:hypothetical protein